MLRFLKMKDKWLLLFLLVSLVPLFQNMSPFDNSVVDIRDIAPRKPAGNWNSDYGAYFPESNSDIQSLGDAQNEFLQHNFSSYLRDFELRYLTLDSRRFRFAEGKESSGSLHEVGQTSHWSLGLINSNKLRLLYLNDKVFNGLKFSMEAGPSIQGVSLRVDQDLGRNWGLGVSHQTELRQSRVQLDYRW